MTQQITSVQVTSYNGHEIMVNGHGQFRTVDADGEPITALSLRDLTAQIDDLDQKRAKTRKLSLAVLLESGMPGVITGFNLRTDVPTGLGQTSIYALYPDVPWLRARLARVHALRHEAAALEKDAQRFVLPVRAGRSLTPQNYVEALDAYEATYQAKRAAALADPQATVEDGLRLVSEEAGA